MLGSAESEEVRLISREIIFQEFQPICMTTIPQRYRQTKRQQESPADATVMRDCAIIPRWPPATVLDFVEPQIGLAPFDLLTPKTMTWNQTWSRSDTPFPRYSRILVENCYIPCICRPRWG